MPLPARVTALAASIVLVASMATGTHTAAAATADSLPGDAFLSAMEGGNTVGAFIREDVRRADGYRHIDTPATIRRLEQMHVTTYTFGIWDQPTDWDDLRHEFAPAAQAAGIDVMVYIVPPSECFQDPEPHLEGRCSRPFTTDYLRWAKEIAQLSLKYPNVVSWGIDDFLVGENRELFTDEYIRDVRAAQDAINPDLKWYVTLYDGQINNPASLDAIEGVLDGVIYPYLGFRNSTIDPTWVERRLDELGGKVRARGMEFVLLIYTGRFLDGIIDPDERYVAEVMRRARPYLADGRISGIIAYAAPLRIHRQQPSWDYEAHRGLGRLSLSVGNHVSTPDGAYAAASQRIEVDPDASAKTLTFHHKDPDAGGLAGYQFKQVLVDGEVVWERDAESDPRGEWLRTEVDLTDALAGKKSATLTFRLFHRKGVGWWPLDLSIDDVTGSGIIVRNGGFEQRADWRLDRNNAGMQPYIDIFHADTPARIFNAIGAAYAGFQGEAFTLVEGGHWPRLRLSPQNRAMYGNGRLAFGIPENTRVPAGTCASASQRVEVDPGLPRYQLSFWHADPYQARFDHVYKEISIDGRELWKRDVGDYWPWFYINGSDHQGPINVTEFVKGKKSVELEFRLCVDKAVDDYGMTFGVDHIQTIGLRVHNAEFENHGAWRLDATAPLTAKVDIERNDRR